MKTNKINVVLSLNKTVVANYNDSEGNDDDFAVIGCFNPRFSPDLFRKYKKTTNTATTATTAQTTAAYSANSGCC